MTTAKPGVSPVLVAAIRGILLAAATAAIGAATVALTSTPVHALAPYAPVLLAGLRVAEGMVDKLRGQAPQALAGSGPAEPTAYLSPVPAFAATVTAAGGVELAKIIAAAVSDAIAGKAVPVVPASSVDTPPPAQAAPVPADPSPTAAADVSTAAAVDASTLPPPAELPGGPVAG